uniref:GYF domain-containing protein n=1 Tax=Elaeophora elaphi TaxID=1147741 RepID=A0A158Q7P3_9BILA
MSVNKWSTDDDLPPPSMRHFFPSLQFPSQNRQLEEKDRILEERLTNLNMDKSENQVETLASLEERAEMLRMNDRNQDTPSVSDIEERLAKLRGIPVEDIRYPRSAILNGSEGEETVEKLMKRARDKAKLEIKWDHFGKSEYDVDPEEFIKMCGNDASLSDELVGKLSISDTDIMSWDTIRNLKDIQRTMKLAKQQSIKAAKLAGNIKSDNRSMDNKIKKLMKLTSQSNKKSEEISDELSKFWDRRLNHEVSSSEYSSKSENSDDDAKIDYEELQKVILEAEKAEMQATEMVKEPKKSSKKNGVFSRIFHSR